MGIDGLHALLKPYLKQSHVSQYRGRRVGVDASSWLHSYRRTPLPMPIPRGAVGCAAELAAGEAPWQARGKDAPYVQFCLRMVAMLRGAGVTPVIVFDGGRLPAKAATNEARRARRRAAAEKGRALLAEGRKGEAQSMLAQCVDVTPEMAHHLILRLRQWGVEYVVSPYEADAQLAHLASLPEAEGGVHAVITEDSDLVAYGCPHILFKCDSAGHGLELRLDNLFRGLPQEAAAPAAAAAAGSTCSGAVGGGTAVGGSRWGGGPKPASFAGWTLEMLQAACVLAGCDFLPSLRGMGFKTAHGWVGRRKRLTDTLAGLREDKRFKEQATPEYCAAAERALSTFRHALVFCGRTAGGCCRRLVPLPQLRHGHLQAEGPEQQQQHLSGEVRQQQQHLPGEVRQQQQQQQQQQHLEQAEEQVQAEPAAQCKVRQQGPQESGAEKQLEQERKEQHLEHLGRELEPQVARGVAYGHLHPQSHQPWEESATVPHSNQQQQQHDQRQQQSHHQRQQQNRQQQNHHQRQQQNRQHYQGPQGHRNMHSRPQLSTWCAPSGSQALRPAHVPPQTQLGLAEPAVARGPTTWQPAGCGRGPPAVFRAAAPAWVPAAATAAAGRGARAPMRALQPPPTSPAVHAGGGAKRKGAPSSGGGVAPRRKDQKLAPQCQRISRFFAPKPKAQE